MKTQRLFGVGVTAAALALTAALVTAQATQDQGRGGKPEQRAGQQGRGGRIGGPMGGPLGVLNLTEEQRTKIAGLRRAEREEAGPVETELRTAETALHRELFADARDGGRVADLAAKVTSLQKQLTDLRVKHSASLSGVLTPEQRATLREREGRGGGPRGGRGSRFGHGPHRH